VVKGGAEGLYSLGLKGDQRFGVAVKMSDGSMRGQPPVVLWVLEQLGALTPAARERLEQFRRPTIRNCHGVEVGSVEAVFDLDL
jgi:L-asparaginase II